MIDSGATIPTRIHDVAATLWVRQHTGDHEAARELADWLAVDERHRRAYQAIVRDWQASAQLSETPLGQGRRLARAPFYMRQSTHVALAAAGAILLLGSSVIWFTRASGDIINPIAVAQAASFATKLGEIRSFRLPDGTRLTLDTNSRVSVKQGVDGLVVEVGAGRVRVIPRPKSSVVVVTVHSRSHVSGGSFDVALDDASASIAAVSQPIRLERAGRSLEIGPGQGAKLNASGRAKHLTTATQMQWTAGMIMLDRTRLDEAVRAINRYNRDQVRVRKPDLASRRLTGAYKARDPLTFAQTAAKMFGLRVERAPGEILLVP
jgi:transmembrane sensor